VTVFALAAAAYLVWFAVIEIAATRLRLPAEVSRKFAHVTMAVGAAALPLWLTQPQVAVLGLLFAVGMVVSWRTRFLSSIHDVRRTTLGEIWFPAGIAAAALVAPTATAFAYAVLTMGVSDVAACLVGERAPARARRIPGGTKTYRGSSAFFVTTVVLGVPFLVLCGQGALRACGVAGCVAAVTTVTEAAAGRGLDNLCIPPVAAAAMILLRITGVMR
jgi:dolichol kinase